MGTDQAVRAQARRRASLGASASAWLIASVALVRVGFLDHQWSAAIFFAVALLVAVLIGSRYLARRDSRALSSAAPGTLFVGQASINVRSVRSDPRFAAAIARYPTWLTSGLLPATLVIDRNGMIFQTQRFFWIKPGSISIPWALVSGTEVTALPAKINVAGMGVLLSNGVRVEVQVRGTERLAAALAESKAVQV